jgi:serine/threonine-protein kinase RsbW
MNPSASNNQWSWKYPASLDNVEKVCTSALAALEEYSLQIKELFSIELLLRESLNNAVIHGCHENPLLSFSCSLMITDQAVVIEVADEGPGFDWRGKLQAKPVNLDETGRGLLIYDIYANSVKFNESGNCITLKINIDQGDKND